MKLIWQILGGILGIFLAVKFISDVNLKVIPGESSIFGITLSQDWQILVLIGGVLGIINSFIKPILNKVTFPLRILTLGLSSLIINMIIIKFLDLLFLEFTISGIGPLFWTTIICWSISFFIGLK